MKILGYTDNDEYIICVSKQEWESLASGTKPKADSTLWYKSEVFTGLQSKVLQGINWRYLLRPFQEGEIDGTWESLENFLRSGCVIPHIGDRGRAKLIETSREFIAKKSGGINGR